MTSREHHYYVFYWNGDSHIPTYERTCGDRRSAQDRCAVLDGGYKLGERESHHAFFTIDCLPREFFA